MTFAQRYNKALAFKSLDVEEPIDVRFHRPLAAAFTALISDLPVTPNQVTVMSLITGLTGSVFLYLAFFNDAFTAPWVWGLSGALLLGAVVLDCADGQLARSRGGGSRFGRILDGIVDVLVLVPVYVILGFGIKQQFSDFWFWASAVAGFSTWIHCGVYDKLKNLYLAHTMPEAGGAEGAETVESVREELRQAQRSGTAFEVLLLRIYLFYLNVQERVASGSTERREVDAAQMRAFRQAHRTTMRLTSWLGLGTHMCLIYLAIIFAGVFPESLLALQVVFAVVFNTLLAVVLIRSRGFAKGDAG